MRRLIPAVLVLAVVAFGCASNPFHKAITKGDVEKVRSTIAADPEKAVETLKDGGYPLHLAVAHHKPDVVRYLLSKGADPNYQYENNGKTPLMRVWPNEVSWMHEIFQERFLDDRGVPKDEYIPILREVTILVDERLREVRAAGYEGDNTALILLEAGADINAVDVEGHNALWHILQYYGPVTVKLLLEEGTQDLDQCMKKVDSDLQKIMNKTLAREDLTTNEKFWIDYGYYSEQYVVWFLAFSRQISYYLIQREMVIREMGVEMIVQ